MKLKELGGKNPKVTSMPYGILYGADVFFAELDGRYYVNLSGTEDGFERVSEEEYRFTMGCMTPKVDRL